MSDSQEAKTSLGDEFRAALSGGGDETPVETAAANDDVEVVTEGESGEFGEGVLDGGGDETPVVSEGTEEVVEEQPWYSELSELGFEGVEDEESARTRLLAAYRDSEEARTRLQQEHQSLSQYVGYGQEYLRLQSDPAYQEFIASRNRPQEPRAEQQPVEAWWNPPAFDASLATKYWRPRVTVDPATNQKTPVIGADGEPVYGWADDTPLEVRTAADSYNQYVDQWTEKLAKRPHEALPPVVMSTVREAIQNRDPQIIEALSGVVESVIRERTQEQDTEQFVRSIQDEEWLYEKDPRTQQPKIDAAGQKVYSPEGRRVMGYVAQAERIGIVDLKEQWNYATMRARLDSVDAQSGQQAKQATAQEVREQKKREHLKRTTGPVPDRGIPQEPSNSQRQTPGQTLLQELEKVGMFS